MEIVEIIVIMFIHWLGDFPMQSDEMAKGKSSSWKYLIQHTSVYSSMFVAFAIFYLGIIPFETYNVDTLTWLRQFCTNVTLFTIVTFTLHTFQDYITSRINKYFWNKGQVHNFFTSVGFDQFLHLSQLLITYQILFK